MAESCLSITCAVYNLAETLEKSFFVKGLQEEAKLSDVWVSVGVHERPADASSQQTPNGHKDNKQCYNSQCLIDPEGNIASVYRKLHLFDVNIKGGLSIQESGTTLKGEAMPDVTKTAVGKGAKFTYLTSLSSDDVHT